MKDAGAERRLASAPSHERRFYASNRAFGRFGIRIFEPQIMPQPHWHGHIEANFAIGTTMTYDMDGQVLTVPQDRLVLFWAGIPHCLTAVQPLVPGGQRLCNIYLPLDAFLMMHHITSLQVTLLGGGMIALPEALCSEAQVRRWYADYRSGDFERTEVVKMELNASATPDQHARAGIVISPHPACRRDGPLCAGEP
jgi:AraC family transcriptional regulator, melibiose operon regulatory protein